jgi:GH18 family chitinase
MKGISCLLLPVFILVLSGAKAQLPDDSTVFKIVGYYSLQSAMTKNFNDVPFDKLTHINLYFLNPDSSGNYQPDFSALIPFVKAAHEKNVKVLASLGGGGKHPYYATLLKEGSRTKLITQLLSIVQQYDLDGIDVDIEGSDIDENYDNLVAELAIALHRNNKLITAATAVFYKGDITDRSLGQFDFLNVMSYDHTGAWATEKPGPHSTYAHAVEDLAYFKTERRIPKNKLILGVPFYGYGFGPTLTTPGISMNYGEIVAKFPGAETKDQLEMGDGKILYYNGMPTIKMKTVLAKTEASGIMIWQLSGDASGAKSLLEVIHQTVSENE